MITFALCATLAAAPVQAPADSLLVSADWLRAHLREPGLVVLQSTETRADFDAGHIPGARFVPMMEFHNHDRSDQLPDAAGMAAALGRLGVSNQSRVVIVADPMSAALLFVALEYLGHGDRTAILDGGMAAWHAVRGDVSRQAAPFPPASFTPRVKTDMVVDAAWVASRLDDPAVRLLDARSRAEYEGTARESLPRRGHIPGAAHLDWVATLNRSGSADRMGESSPEGGLRSRQELERLFTDAGVRPGSTVVTYCTIGMRASHLYFVARLLGHSPRLYVGSMADWVRDAARPVDSAEGRR